MSLPQDRPISSDFTTAFLKGLAFTKVLVFLGGGFSLFHDEDDMTWDLPSNTLHIWRHISCIRRASEPISCFHLCNFWVPCGDRHLRQVLVLIIVILHGSAARPTALVILIIIISTSSPCNLLSVLVDSDFTPASVQPCPPCAGPKHRSQKQPSSTQNMSKRQHGIQPSMPQASFYRQMQSFALR